MKRRQPTPDDPTEQSPPLGCDTCRETEAQVDGWVRALAGDGWMPCPSCNHSRFLAYRTDTMRRRRARRRARRNRRR